MINIGDVWSIITSKRVTISLSRSKEYGGVETLYVPSERIWLPDIVLYNNAGKEIMPTMYISILPSKLAHQSYLTLKITSMFIFKHFGPHQRCTYAFNLLLRKYSHVAANTFFFVNMAPNSLSHP